MSEKKIKSGIFPRGSRQSFVLNGSGPLDSFAPCNTL